jgi:uncharacterized surface protein with fasciclin (FAS1) repeats
MKNIIETAVDNPDFSTLVTAIKAAGLVDTLAGTGPFTVFAPTNEAFAKIPSETLTEVLADKVKLASILKYHVVTGKVTSAEVTDMSEVKTLEGSNVKVGSEHEVTVEEVSTPEVSVAEISAQSGIMINDATITMPDIECSNGIIHAIDTVLMP